MPRPDAPLAGRRLWFVGIGGAGLSAYARLAQAWGAEVGGWDRVRTPYLEGLETEVEISAEPVQRHLFFVRPFGNDRANAARRCEQLRRLCPDHLQIGLFGRLQVVLRHELQHLAFGDDRGGVRQDL